MSVLARLVAVLVVLFTFLGAPRISGLRTTPTPQVVGVLNPSGAKVRLAPGPLSPLWCADDAEEPKLPKLVRPRLAAGEKWVYAVRLAGGDEVSDETIKPLTDKINAANEAGVDVIVLELNTPGGDVGVGREFERVLERSKAPVQCVVDGTPPPWVSRSSRAATRA